MTPILDIVIVTYNRLEKLKKALHCYEEQSQGFRNLILVNNCSTDGTKEWIDKWASESSDKFLKVVIHAPKNMGGAGGFYLGQKKSLELGADWVFVADDDAYATPNMVEEFYKFTNEHDCRGYSAICASVHNLDDRIDEYHRDRYEIIDGRNWLFKELRRFHVTEDDYKKEYFSIDFLSYVGSFINASAMKKYGTANHDYFIFFDDSEHSIRLKKFGDIIVVPRIKINHEGGATGKDSNVLSWRSYYSMRNEFHMRLKHFPRTTIYDIYIALRKFGGRIIHRRNTNEYDMLEETAIFDAIRGHLGKHKKYKPGWEVKLD